MFSNADVMYHQIFLIQPDGDLWSLCQSVSCTLQTSIDLSHLYGSLQSHHLQALIAHICEVARHSKLIKFKQVGCDCVREGRALKKTTARKRNLTPSCVLPCGIVLRSSGSVMTSLFSTFGMLSGFLDSPQRLEPPCMLGMLRTAMPSSDMLLRSRGLPQHW